MVPAHVTVLHDKDWDCVCVFGLWLGNHRAGEVMHVSEPTQDGVSGRASCYRGVENFSLLIFTPSLPSSFSASLFTWFNFQSPSERERERPCQHSACLFYCDIVKHCTFYSTFKLNIRYIFMTTTAFVISVLLSLFPFCICFFLSSADRNAEKSPKSVDTIFLCYSKTKLYSFKVFYSRHVEVYFTANICSLLIELRKKLRSITCTVVFSGGKTDPSDPLLKLKYNSSRSND